MPNIDPTTIVVRRGTRQRRSLDDIEELKLSIATLGQINPVIVRRDGDEIVLVAGERRLRACVALSREIEVKFWEDLSELDAREIELEENIKREDLPWRDQVNAIATLHTLYQSRDATWTVDATAQRLSVTKDWIYKVITVSKNINAPILADSTGIMHAYSVLQRQAERRAASIVGEISAGAASAFGGASPQRGPTGASAIPVQGVLELNRGAPSASSADASAAPPPPPPISCASFLEWASAYTGPKFNLIHCDFPFGIKFTGGMGQEEHGIKYEEDEDTYWTLLNALCDASERLASYSSHLMFWFTMSFYTETCQRLRGAGWKVQDHPLVWYKSDGQGLVPGRNEYPRRVYETALLASRGTRPLVKMIDNCYGAPRAANALHPSQKPEPVLRHFFGGLVDATTDLFDPTCGSGSAPRDAEDSCSRKVLRTELNPDFARAANAATLNARLLRKAAR